MNSTTTETATLSPRDKLARMILIFALVGCTAIAVTVIALDKASAKDVMTAVLPLLASWVGTILAYYFSKDNFEAATRSVSQLASQMSGDERLRSTAVREKMIPRADMHVEPVTDPAAVKLKDVLARQKSAGKGKRIPFVNAQDHPLYVIHTSMINDFLARQLLAPPAAPTAVADITLADLLADPVLQTPLRQTFATVKESATLAEAKAVMDAIPGCQDVLVTRGGHNDEPLLGWVTNNIVQENSRAV